MIECRGLVKRFGKFEALKGVDIEVKRGEIFGLVGPNGAGKTTAVRILTGIMKPDAGSVKVLGMDITKDGEKIRKRIGYLPEEPHLYENLTPRELFEFFFDIYEVPKSERSARFEKLISLVGLKERSDDRIEVFSKGMRHKLSFARCLLNNPEVLFLDEPTMGLDPATAIQIRQYIASLKNNSHAILLCTHYMNEAELLCDQISFIINGKIVEAGTPKGLKSKYKVKDLDQVFVRVLDKG